MRLVVPLATILCFAWVQPAINSPPCGSTLTEKVGYISTPNFPEAFPTPIHCQWLISKGENDANASIVVYLTQVFVTSGLKFTEYLYYDAAYKAGARVVHTVSESSATHVKWLQVSGPFLLIELSLDQLEGHHLRALPKLLDVFGFNITYEISSAANPVKPFQCNTIECRFLGHCYANHNYSEYGCSCFAGYSGKDCGEGPLCARHGRPTCHNGGTCRQMGAAAVSCDCPPGVTGDLCELPILEPASGCEDGTCIMECPFDGNPANACNCNKNNSEIVTSDRMIFEAKLKLADRPKVTIELRNQITSYLRSVNVSKSVEVTNISSEGDVTIEAWGVESWGSTFRTSIQTIAMTRLAGLRVTPGSLRFSSEPALFLQTVDLNQRPVVWEGAEFILSCVSQGSPFMVFNWYKDGTMVNVSKATRNTWTRLVGMEGSDGTKWSALLGVAHAAKLDAGLFRCQVSYKGRQQCRTIRLHVLAPEVRLAPMSVTAYKGDNVTLTCLSANSGGLHGKLGYSWTKNKALFPLTPGAEVWEDLAPAGSILHLYNIQKSGEYSCHVSSAVSARVRSVYVRAVSTRTNGNGGLCPSGLSFGLGWPAAAPSEHFLECPPGFSGRVTRICEMKNAPYESEWNVPDFRDCTADELADIHNEFERLTNGYGNGTATGILKKYLHWIMKRPWLYPGEGSRIVRMIKESLDYARYINYQTDKDTSVEPFFKITNHVLKSDYGALDQQGLQDLQQAVAAGATLTNSSSYRLSEMSVYFEVVNSRSASRVEFPSKNISHEPWDKESVEMYLTPIETIDVSDKVTLIFVNYKNLTKYFSSLYYSTEMNTDNNGVEFWVASHIALIKVASNDGTSISLETGKLSFNLLLYHSSPIARPNTEGTIVCGKYDNSMWTQANCEFHHPVSDVTQCSCNEPGMYALLLSRKTSQGQKNDSGQNLDLIAGAFGGSALGVLLSGLLLIPAWLRRRCCLMYLKLHYCCVTSIALGLTLYCFTTDMCGNMAGGWVELLLLGGGAALVAQLLLLHAELAWPAPPPPHLPKTILMLMTGVCVLAALCSRAAGGDDWGLKYTSTPLTVFISASSLLIALHFLLCICVAARLRLLATKLPDRNNYIQKRMGLMRRSAAIFLCSIAMQVSLIVHHNIPSPITTNTLAGTTMLLGVMVFCCYIIRDETSAGIRRLLRPKETDWDCSSDYVNTSLSFFIKQGGEAESRSAPLGENSMPLAQNPTHWRTPPSHAHHSSDHRDRSMGKQADIVKSVEFKNIPPGMDSPDRAPSGSIVPVSSVCDLVPSCASSLPSVDPPTPHPQEYVTRVCVELGILSRTAPPPPGPPEPPILLCSVDFEPYSDRKYEISGGDNADNCVLCIGKSKQESDVPTVAPVPIKSCLKNKDAQPIYNKITPLKESPSTESEDESNLNSESDSSKNTPLCEAHASEPNIDGMLDLISHDLDYLLNRTAPTSPAQIPSNVKHVRQPSGDTKLFTVLDKIQEESL